ncbi:M1 family metallopeptidase [Winogradskyella sp. PC D3.3]
MKKIVVVLCIFIFNLSLAQQTDYLDFKKAKVSLDAFDENLKKVIGKVDYVFDVLKPVDSIFLDSKNIHGYIVSLNGNDNINYYVENDKFWLIHKLRPSKDNVLSLTFEANPKKALYFLNRDNDTQIWTQGQGKYTSNWLPSLDDVNDKIEYDFSITFRNGYEVLANGKLIDKQVGDAVTTWKYDMKQPMSSYLAAIVIGKYNKKTATSKSGIPLEYYYYVEDSLRVESTYRYSKQLFDFLEEEIGVPYPWKNYKQVPVHDFLYAGMENTSLTVFSDALVVDDIAFNDKNYVGVNAHELAHQWFGDLVTAKSGEHHWLQEGFATYYALLAERDVFGDNYFHFKLLESVLELSRQDLSGKGTSLLDPKSSSLTFYQRGAWVLHALRDKVGEVVFKKAVENYLKKYQFSTVETSDFIVQVENLYGQSLSHFVNYWIKNKAFPYEAAFSILKRQSTFINEYAMVDCEAKSSKCAEYLKYYVSDEAKVKIISQVPELVTADTFKNSLKVRQAIAEHVTKIPEDLKGEYESLLDDKSYITIEKALYNLWVNFPLERSKYLSKTRGKMGFSDKGLRMLWIILNLNTPYYEADGKQELFNELVSYTGEAYNADVRINAFNYLDLIKSCNEACQSNLELAKSHHNWRLVKFAKQLSEKLEKKEN